MGKRKRGREGKGQGEEGKGQGEFVEDNGGIFPISRIALLHASLGQAGGRDLTRTTPLTIIMIKMIGVLLMRVNISKTFLILTNITQW